MARDQLWLDYKSFDIEAWQLLRRKFDASWLIPGKILGMACPVSTSHNPAFPNMLTSTCEQVAGSSSDSLDTSRTFASMSTVASIEDLLQDDFASFLARSGVDCLVRLNTESECDDINAYRDMTMAVPRMVTESLAFPDLTAPPVKTVKQFSKTVNDRSKSSAVIAVHCKAGLGRTGALVGAYIAANYGISGSAVYGWLRLCRPGAVQTPEQERFIRAQGPTGSKDRKWTMNSCLKMQHKSCARVSSEVKG